MSNPRAPKEILEKKSFKDGAIYLSRRKTSKNGFWDIRLKIPGHKGYITKASGTADEHKAYAIADKLYNESFVRVHQGQKLDIKRITTGIDDYLKHQVSVGVAKNDMHTLHLARQLKPFLKSYVFTDLDLPLVTKMLAYIAEESRKGSLTPGSQKRNLSRLKGIFLWWCENGYLSKMPGLPKISVKDSPRPDFAGEEYSRLTLAMTNFVKVKHAPTRRDRVMLVNYVLILSNTGLRSGEARNLRWRDVRAAAHPNDESRQDILLNVDGKTGKRTVVASDGHIIRYFQRILELREADLTNPNSDIYGRKDVPADGYVFCHPDGTPIMSFRKSFASLIKYAKLEGKNWTPYSLRHTYATLRLIAKTPAYTLSKNMGTSVDMIERYYGHTDSQDMIDQLTKRSAPGSNSGKRVRDAKPTSSLDWLRAPS